ncbi:MAG: radical SAM protein [Candidatus Odinarchaeota archaeon]
MVKKIVLVNPSTPEYAMKLFPPLSLASLAAFIPDDYEVKIIDNNFQRLDYDADLAAITANTYSIRRAYLIANQFRERGIPVVLGGNHPSILPEESMRYADSVVVGDGELVWQNLLQDLEEGKLRKVYKSGLFDFSKFKIPRRDLIKNEYKFESFETVRGCPLDCYFCSVTRFHGRTYRYKPLNYLKKEVESLKKKNVFIVDDNIIGVGGKAVGRAVELFGLLKEYSLHWMGQASINIADDERILKLLAESGCMFLFIGFESIDPNILSSFNKKLNLSKGVSNYKNIVKKIHDYGVGVMGSFIIGTDFDTKDSLNRLKDFIIESDIDIPNITHLTPYPGTKIYDKLVSENRLFNNQFWLEDPFPLFTFKPKNLTIQELYDISLEMTEQLNSMIPVIFRFLKSIIGKRSFRRSVFSMAESLITGRTFKNNLKKWKIKTALISES